jgi:26S proteasome regulatory subunit N8
MPVNHQIVYHLQDALNLLPDLTVKETEESFVSSTNDWLLVVYLSSLVRAIIALHALVDNKASIGRAELDEGGEDGKEKKGAKDKEKSEGDSKKDKDKDKESKGKEPDPK